MSWPHYVTGGKVGKKQPSVTRTATWNTKSFVTSHARSSSLQQLQRCLFAHTGRGFDLATHTSINLLPKEPEKEHIQTQW